MAEGTIVNASRTESMRGTVAALMPQLKGELARLVAIPSISAPSYPEATHAPLRDACGAVRGSQAES